VLEKRRREKELAKFWVITGTVRDTLQCINKLNHTEPLKIKFFSDIDSGISLNLRSGQKVGGKHKQLPQLSKKVGTRYRTLSADFCLLSGFLLEFCPEKLLYFKGAPAK
jgi:hypothetical protein